MTHTVTAGDREITYELTRKKVKNITKRSLCSINASTIAGNKESSPTNPA